MMLISESRLHLMDTISWHNILDLSSLFSIFTKKSSINPNNCFINASVFHYLIKTSLVATCSKWTMKELITALTEQIIILAYTSRQLWTSFLLQWPRFFLQAQETLRTNFLSHTASTVLFCNCFCLQLSNQYSYWGTKSECFFHNIMLYCYNLCKCLHKAGSCTRWHRVKVASQCFVSATHGNFNGMYDCHSPWPINIDISLKQSV